jgi:hypothetical protein
MVFGCDFVADSPVILFEFLRSESVKPQTIEYAPSGKSVVLLDAGHLCQTFCLVATWLGLAPFCTAALKDTLIEKELGLDVIRESVLYLAAVGTFPAGKLRSNR